MKNGHPLNGARIRTLDLWNMSLLPQPLNQGSISCQQKIQVPFTNKTSNIYRNQSSIGKWPKPTFWCRVVFVVFDIIVRKCISWEVKSSKAFICLPPETFRETQFRRSLKGDSCIASSVTRCRIKMQPKIIKC